MQQYYTFIKKHRNIFLCLLLIVLAGLFLYVNATRPKPPPEIMAWIYPGEPACNASTEYSDGRTIDILKPQYFNVDDTGTLVFLTVQQAGCNAFSADNLASVKKYSKEQYITVTNSGAGGLGIFLQNSTTENNDVNTLVSFAVNNNVTGIEIDFENFNNWDANMYSNYKNFIQNLGNALHAQNKKLMVDGPAVVASEKDSNIFKYADFVNLPVDKMVVLAYDYQFDHGVGQPISPVAWVKDIISTTEKSFPDKSKISIGISSYGYMGTSTTGEIKILTFDQMRGEPGFLDAVRNDSSFEMTWTNGDNVYFYNDSQSMADMLKVVQDAGINSVSVWHLGGNPWFLNTD